MFHLANLENIVTPRKVLCVVGIAILHIVASGFDQFIANVFKGEGLLHQVHINLNGYSTFHHRFYLKTFISTITTTLHAVYISNHNSTTPMHTQKYTLTQTHRHAHKHTNTHAYTQFYKIIELSEVLCSLVIITFNRINVIC